MAHEPQELTLEPGAWGPDADRLIAQAVQHASPADIRHQVENLGARLFYVRQAGAIRAAFVLRVDGREGVIVAAAGDLPGADLTASCMPAIESLFVGCDAIRYHTARPALARKLATLGYQAREIVCMKELNHEPVAA